MTRLGAFDRDHATIIDDSEMLLGRDPARCLVIEDARTGITAARAAGAQVLAVRTTFTGEELEGADFQVSGLDGLAFLADADGVHVS